MFEQKQMYVIAMLAAIAFVSTAAVTTSSVFAESDGVPDGNAWGVGMGLANQNDGSHGSGSGFSDSVEQGTINSEGESVHIDGDNGESDD